MSLVFEELGAELIRCRLDEQQDTSDWNNRIG